MSTTRISFSSITIILALAFLTIFPISSAQAPAMSPGAPTAATLSDDCTTALLNMSDCLTYVEDGSNLTKPDKPCCPELAGLVDTNPICLCELLGNSSSFGIQVDNNRALGLPKVCRVSTPSASLCSEVGIPIGAPTAEGSGGSSPKASTPGGSAMSPSTKNGASSGFYFVFLIGLSCLVLETLPLTG
ncbi:hypothetical protein NE237_005220 [Protea cynaroides]|uniref:Bifunctional inhibitor/plant lipid transfer protein/seed storage helical domain-containing protein n=1 Tax=Protea cynaroides TaxID=273540 RepID=A0A9Q0KKX5_9MAGN|nr:hypothetical protein NE237_005220 [Protea cynaroides]